MVAIWICICAFLSCAGWLLSALHLLNRTGYLILFALAGVVLVALSKRTGTPIFPRIRWAVLQRRFRRGFPLAFLLLAGLAILGGVLHAPSNYDGLTYRTPRVLHWLAAEQWHWIHAELPRLNVRTAGYEWVTTPIIAFLKTDRLLFLINSVSFLLLPGLIFSLLHRLGVRRKVAWYWMWILPTGYTYLLQAGSIGNDLFGSVFAFAAIDFGLRARASRHIRDVLLSLLAAALVTGAKSSNLAIGLAWLAAVGPALLVVRHHLKVSLAVGLVAVVGSVIPNSLLNVYHCGDWSGQVLEQAAFGGASLFRLPINLVGFTLQNLAPPVFPFAKQWAGWVQQMIPAEVAEKIQAHFESGAGGFKLGEMQTEESAGLGFGVCVLLIGSFVAASFVRRTKGKPAPRWGSHQILVIAGAWIAVLVFMSQNGLSGAVRYLAPYNIICIVPFLVGSGHAAVICSKWWKQTCGCIFALAALLLVLNQARPLWPAVTVLRSLGANNSSQQLVRRAWTVYSVYSQRADAFAPARALVPLDLSPLGFVSFDDPETSLWRPFGSRRILHLKRTETAAELRQRGIKCILVSSVVLTRHWQMSLDDWLRQVDGEVVSQLPLDLRAGAGPKEWYLVMLH
jgi:hypothetical protein